MIIPVHMLAYAQDKNSVKIRNVEIPDKEYEFAKAESVMNVLELVFKYGQNDFQPQNMQNMPSVSVGDVVGCYDGQYWMVMGTGWKGLSKEEFDKVPVPSSMYAYEFAIKESIKE
jgi:hypothetical protein